MPELPRYGPTWTTEIVALTAHRSASPDESTSAPVEVQRRVDDQRDTDHRRVVLEHDIQAGVALGVDDLRPRDAIAVNGCSALDCPQGSVIVL
jgi:hypothetical protein